MTTQTGRLHQLFETNFLEYTSYVIKERAIPAIEDGLKPVQRRILQTLHNMDDGRYHKVANVVGETMKLHPHGDASIFAALVNLANKGFLIVIVVPIFSLIKITSHVFVFTRFSIFRLL